MKSYIYTVFHVHLLWLSNIYMDAYTPTEVSPVLPYDTRIIHRDVVVAAIFSIHSGNVIFK